MLQGFLSFLAITREALTAVWATPGPRNTRVQERCSESFSRLSGSRGFNIDHADSLLEGCQDRCVAGPIRRRRPVLEDPHLSSVALSGTMKTVAIDVARLFDDPT